MKRPIVQSLNCPAVSIALFALCVAGCAQVNNPWEDSSARINSEMSTPSSVNYSQNKSEFALASGRTWPPGEVRYENGAVTHWPLWFEDPFEDKGNGITNPANRDAPDNVFAWNAEDYFAMFYSPARMILNTAAWPISAIVTPPGTLMESDGHLSKGLLGYDHDAKRSDSATREPPFTDMLNHDLTAPVAEPEPTTNPAPANPEPAKAAP